MVTQHSYHRYAEVIAPCKSTSLYPPHKGTSNRGLGGGGRGTVSCTVSSWYLPSLESHCAFPHSLLYCVLSLLSSFQTREKTVSPCWAISSPTAYFCYKQIVSQDSSPSLHFHLCFLLTNALVWPGEEMTSPPSFAAAPFVSQIPSMCFL